MAVPVEPGLATHRSIIALGREPVGTCIDDDVADACFSITLRRVPISDQTIHRSAPVGTIAVQFGARKEAVEGGWTVELAVQTLGDEMPPRRIIVLRAGALSRTVRDRST
jgi:hypothetical protein